MATQSRVGGLQSGTPSTVAPNLKGPATGGYIVFPFVERINGSAGATSIDAAVAPLDMRVVSISAGHILAGDASGATFLRSGTTQLNQTIGGQAPPKFFSATNEQSVLGNTYVVARTWATAAVPQDQIEGVTARNLARGTVLDFRETGNLAVSYGYTAHAFCAVRGHRYDPDNVSSDFPYSATGD